MTRMDDLLVSTASELKAGRAPLNDAWLYANSVTFDEATDLADALATAIHVYRATMNIGLQLGKYDKGGTLPELVMSMSIRQSGVGAILAEAMRLEEMEGFCLISG